MQMSGAEIFVKTLADLGVEIVFGYPGGAVLNIYDALFQHTKVKHMLCRHEQGAVHMADGYARASGKTGVCVVTSGPGATNTVTGIATAYMDSIPHRRLLRAGAFPPDRQRRVPGGRHHRHHPARAPSTTTW